MIFSILVISLHSAKSSMLIPNWLKCVAVQIEELIGTGHHEHILFKLHFKRNTPYSADEKKAILSYLANHYVSSNDVRYFNEFLWFYKDTDNAAGLNELCHSTFKGNLDAKGKHKFPLATQEEV